MNKRLRLPLAVALALGNLPAFALGLGQIEVKSSLNQPLVAEIPVLSATAGEAEALAVRLASADAFARAGLERPHLMNANLQFEVKRTPSGRTVIAVTTPNQVREPFLSFLLEVEWGNGKLLREYTVLLDPPSMAPIRSAPSASVAATALPEPAPARYEPLDEPPAPPPPAPRPSAPAPAPAPVQQAPAPSYAPPSEPLPSYGADSYSVVAGDTLWSIASRSRPDPNVSVQQMMLALLRANPEAFIDNNINRLKKGAVLRIPGRDETTVITAAEAAAQVRGQMESWSGASATSAQPADAPVRPESGSRRPSSGTSTSRLELTPPGGEGSAAQSGASASGEGRELRAELDRSREQVNSLKQENLELKSRVQELEGIQGDARKLIELKDSELAAAQRRLSEAEQRLAAATAAEAASAASAVAPVVTPAEPEPVAQQDQDEALAPFETDAAAGQGEGETTAAADAVSEPVALSDAPAAPVAPPEAPKPAETKPAPAPAAPAQETGGGLPFNPWIIGGGALALISLVALLLTRRRGGKGAEAKSSGKGKAIAAAPVDEAATDDAYADASASQDAVQDDDQLEAELIDALGQYPNDLALHLDLLRHYFGRGDAAAFENAAEGMYAQVYDSGDPNWLQAVEMGRVIAPEHPLFAELDITSEVTSPQPAVAPESDVEWTAPVTTEVPLWDEPAPPEPVTEPATSHFFEDVTAVRPAIQEEDFGADSDAAATKLELARAYLDMGDAEGARGMLEEVLGEGSAAQREEARKLLADMH